MALPEREIESRPKPQSMLSQELKDAGWKLERKVINDDEEHPQFQVTNEKFQLSTGPKADLDEAIAAAELLDARSSGKKTKRKAEHEKMTSSATAAKTRDAVAKGFEVSATGEQIFRFERTPAGPVRELLHELIRTDGGTQPREQLDLAVVDRYAQEMTDGAVFPPVTVFHDGRHYWLADGFHRLFACRKACGDSHPIAAEIRTGTQRDAILFSIGANATHGLQRSNEDKRRAVRTLLADDEWRQMSDTVIAKTANVSQPFVSSLRRELSQNVLSESTPPTQPVKRVGSDGVARDTSRIGKSRATVTPARTDITVARSEGLVDITSADPAPAPAPQSGGWPEDSLTLAISVKAGKSFKRAIMVSGRVGEGTPIFVNEFTAADLVPLPPALAALFGRLGAAKASTPKPVKSGANAAAVAKKKATRKVASRKPAKKK